VEIDGINDEEDCSQNGQDESEHENPSESYRDPRFIAKAIVHHEEERDQGGADTTSGKSQAELAQRSGKVHTKFCAGTRLVWCSSVCTGTPPLSLGKSSGAKEQNHS
jgi:hypothetical protein